MTNLDDADPSRVEVLKDMCKPLLAIVCIAAFLCAVSGAIAEARVSIQLTYPSGQSPKVFTTGWLFGAKVMADGKDITGDVQWSGTGTFAPAKGSLSRPSFNKPGPNTITLSVDYGGRRFSRDFAITAVSPDGYAAMGDRVTCPADAHGCPACPHPVTGVINRGSPNVLVRGKPAARKGDGGTHVACCGPNIFEIIEGDTTVLIDGKPAARKGDKTKHCGGTGRIDGTPPTPEANKPLRRSASSSGLSILVLVKAAMPKATLGVGCLGVSGLQSRNELTYLRSDNTVVCLS